MAIVGTGFVCRREPLNLLKISEVFLFQTIGDEEVVLFKGYLAFVANTYCCL